MPLKPLELPEIDGQPLSVCASGERYVTLTATGVKKEGAAFKRFFDDEEAAWKAYNAELSDFINRAGWRSSDFIVWRTRPRVLEETGKFQVWSRLVITNKTQTVLMEA